MEVPAGEALILDTNTFVAEIGLTSRRGSALKHYLSCRGMQLVVPEVVAEEYERHLIDRARKRKRRIQESLQWLGRFCGGVNGWLGPEDDTIVERAGQLARAEHLGAVIVPETPLLRQLAESRNQARRPPSHNKTQPTDCLVWEQCLDLLARCHVDFVSEDGDFRASHDQDRLHPKLWAEAKKVGEYRLTFHRTMGSLLASLNSEIEPLPRAMVFAFVYQSIAPVMEELESNSGCRPKRVGRIKQTLLTTDQASIIEVRLEIEDKWESADRAKTTDFHMSGTCRYSLVEERFCDLTASSVQLLTPKPDGSNRAVKGSFVRLGGHAYLGAPPIHPEPEELGTWVSTD